MSTDFYVTSREKQYEFETFNSDFDRNNPDFVKCHLDKTYIVFHYNVTANLTEMAEHIPLKIYDKDERQYINTNLYSFIWETNKIFKNEVIIVNNIISPLFEVLGYMILNERKLSQYNPKNGWGSFDTLLNFLSDLIRACCKFPDSKLGL